MSQEGGLEGIGDDIVRGDRSSVGGVMREGGQSLIMREEREDRDADNPDLLYTGASSISSDAAAAADAGLSCRDPVTAPVSAPVPAPEPAEDSGCCLRPVAANLESWGLAFLIPPAAFTP